MADKHFARNRACQVCGTLNLSVLYENQLAVIDGRDMSYSVTTCSHCGFHYANQLPKASSYQSYYRSLSKYDVTLSASSIPEIDNYRAEKVISFIQPYISLDKKICTVDESFSSKEAGTYMTYDAYKDKSSGRLDSASACVILSRFLKEVD